MVFQEDSGYGGLFSALSRQTEQLTIFTNTVTPGKIQHFSILWMIQLLQTLFLKVSCTTGSTTDLHGTRRSCHATSYVDCQDSLISYLYFENV